MTTLDSATNPSAAALRVWRIEIHPANSADDPTGASVLHDIREAGLAPEISAVHSARVYLIQAAFDQDTVERIATELLADPVNQRYRLGATPREQGVPLIEVHYLPGVMDPVAMSTTDAITEMLSTQAAGRKPQADVQVRTGFRYDMPGATAEQAITIAQRLLANPVIQSISDLPEWPQKFVEGSPYELNVTHVAIRDLDDEALNKMSREAHLFLSLQEMQGVRDYFRSIDRDPTDIELETLAQTWSEHCVHKTLKSSIRYSESGAEGLGPRAEGFANKAGHTINDDGSITIDNLLKSTIAAATHKLRDEGVNWCISVFEDNAGVIEFDETDAVSFKVETHNHPSAIEPYGGAATGIGGCIRDTIGTGLAAKPIANSDIFCVADPTMPPEEVPAGVLHPRRILKQVVAGVRDYGNRMGIPTVNGAVWFDDRYLGNPLVFCGSVGLIPRDKCFGDPRKGDRIIVLGGRTGRDGIHGATFSSAELTDTHADEFSHAVQIGNAITEKKTLDVILQARDPRKEDGSIGEPLFTAITDCGAGGYSSAVGEMGEKIGANVQLDKAPLKYDGLSYTEIWISEAQERMVLSVPPENVDALLKLAADEDVEAFDLGEFGTENAELILNYGHTEVGRMSMDFLHNGIPQPTREAMWSGPLKRATPTTQINTKDHGELLHSLLSHPNIASKHWIIRQYDHEVQGGSVVKPLVGPAMDGPADAAVIRPKLDSQRGVAMSCGLATAFGDIDPYWMTLAAIDEAVRNAICVGADPARIAILDNFCWAKCDKPDNLGALVRAAEACYDGALAYRTPFISGKDSLNNQFTREDGSIIEIPPTLLISAMGIVNDTHKCITMDAKASGSILLQVGATTGAMGGSHYNMLSGTSGDDLPQVDLARAPHQLATVAKLIADQHVRSAHDCSEGGLLVAAAEMAFAGRLGLELNLAGVPRDGAMDDTALCFAETPSRILLEVAPNHFHDVAKALTEAGVPFGQIGTFNDGGRLTAQSESAGQLVDESLDDLRQAWLTPLDW